MKNTGNYIIVGLWLLTAIVLFLHYNDHKNTPPVIQSLSAPTESKGKTFEVKRIVVLTGDTFDLTIKDEKNSRVLGKLSVNATQDAKSHLVNMFNTCSNPKVTLNKKEGNGYWEVNISVLYQDKQTDIIDWLVSNNLVYK